MDVETKKNLMYLNLLSSITLAMFGMSFILTFTLKFINLFGLLLFGCLSLFAGVLHLYITNKFYNTLKLRDIEKED